MRDSYSENSGFTLIELVMAIAVAALIAVGTIPYMQAKVQVLRAEKTAAEMKTWLEAGLAYYSANTAWPADQNVLVAAEYATANDLLNPWGNPYTVRPNGANLEVTTTFGNHANIGVEKLPNAVATGMSVTARVVVPGVETAHERLLNRYGDAGRNAMMASLDMNGNPVDNANAINIRSGDRLTVQGGDVDVRGQTNILNNNYGLVLKDGSGAQNNAAQSQAGSAAANDIFLRSLDGGNKWLSQRTSRYVAQESYYVTNNMLVVKPNCPGGSPRIFLMPALVQQNLNVNGLGSSLYRATHASATMWRITSVYYGPSGATAGGSALAMTYCYF